MAGGREGEYGGAGYGGDSKQVGQQAGANTGYGTSLVHGKSSLVLQLDTVLGWHYCHACHLESKRASQIAKQAKIQPMLTWQGYM